MRLRQLFREQEQTPEVADIIVFWLKDGERVQFMFENVPIEEIRKPDFEDKLRTIVETNFEGFLIRYQVVGDTTSQGNPDGNTPDTEVPTILTSPDNDEVPPVEQRPDEIEAPAASSSVMTLVHPNEVAAWRYNAELSRRDQNDDGIDDETGEVQPKVYTDGTLRNPDNPQEIIGTVPGYVEPRQGGGLDGDTGDEGTEGEEGAVTGEQRAEIPSIIEELRAAMQGLGTSEGRMINALRRIETSAHLEAVVQMYRQEYGDSLPQDMIDEFKYDLGGNNAAQVEEINRIMRPLGWEITGTRYLSMRWQKYDEAATARRDAEAAEKEQEETFDASDWGGDETLSRFSVAELKAAREKYYQNLTREEELFFEPDNGPPRQNIPADEQEEIDRLEQERLDILDKYGRGILRVGPETTTVRFRKEDN